MLIVEPNIEPVMKKNILITSLLLILIITSCISTKSTIKNINDKAPTPTIIANNIFEITKFSTDKKYGYHHDYPINVGFSIPTEGPLNERRFLDALQGSNGEKITYKKIGSCCPFPTKKTEIGGGLLNQYEITWEGQKKAIILYLNMYEKGDIMVPMGFTLKK